MTFLGKIIRRLGYCSQRLKNAYFLIRFVRLDRPVLKRLDLGAGVRLNVPVRSGGSGVLRIGRNNSFGYPYGTRLGSGEILIQPRRDEAEIRIGDNNFLNNNVTIVANERIVIGDGCLIGDQVTIYDSDFHEISPAIRRQGAGPSQPVLIGNNVWLGSRVMVLKGVTIGDNSVIGAMSLVAKSIPANCIAAGNPAKVIRNIE